MNKRISHQDLEDAIIDLYLSIKIRKKTEVDNYTKEASRIERERLKASTPLLTIINYIKTNFEVLIETKVNDKLKKLTYDPMDFSAIIGSEGANEYEKLLRRHEGEIRNYIGIINKLRLNLDGLINKNDQLEKILLEYKHKTENAYVDTSEYQKEISTLSTLVKTYERNHLKIPVLEKKLKKQKIELTNCQEQIRSQSRKIEQYERDVSLTRMVTLSPSESGNQIKKSDTTFYAEAIDYNNISSIDRLSTCSKTQNNSIANTARSNTKKNISFMMKGGNCPAQITKKTMIPKCSSISHLKDHYKKIPTRPKSNRNASFHIDNSLTKGTTTMNDYTMIEDNQPIQNSKGTIDYSLYPTEKNKLNINKMVKRLCVSGNKGKKTISRTKSLVS